MYNSKICIKTGLNLIIDGQMYRSDFHMLDNEDPMFRSSPHVSPITEQCQVEVESATMDIINGYHTVIPKGKCYITVEFVEHIKSFNPYDLTKLLSNFELVDTLPSQQ